MIGKHFLGTDRPAIHQRTDGSLVGSYALANGSLFISGASAQDIVQGGTGDCYYLSSLAGVACDKNALIGDMFKANSDDTWSVRFFTNGKLDYVTVDRMMATDASGQYIYANAGRTVSAFNELWVALAEKAYAQVNESGRIGQDGNNYYGNGNDNGIGWGWSTAAIKHITGIDASAKRVADLSNASELIGVVNSNRVVTVGGFNANAVNSNAGETAVGTAVQGHAYTITSYDPITGRFEIRNPWGSRHLRLTYDQLRQLGGDLNWSNS